MKYRPGQSPRSSEKPVPKKVNDALNVSLMGWMIATRGTTVSLESFELNWAPVPLNSLSHSDSLVNNRISPSIARCEKREIPAGLELAVWALSADAAMPVPRG